MQVKNNYFLLLLIFTANLMFYMAGCDITGERDSTELPEPGFNYEIVDENGITINRVTHKKIDEQEVETSLGLFGNEFMSAQLLEQLTQQLGLDQEMFRRDEIILHAESGIDQDVHFASLKFTFPKSAPFGTGSHQISSLPKEHLLNIVHIFWEMRRDRMSAIKLNQSLNNESQIIWSFDDSVQMNYFEFGFGLQDIQYMYFSTGGNLTINSVTEERISGSFSVDLAGIPILIFDLEEFPAEPELREIRIIGEFTAEPGDFEDLKQIRTDLLRNSDLPFIPLF